MSLRQALAPKSDQLNADDLIGDVTKIITITKVNIKVGAEQPIVINYQNDNGKPWKPCKGMGRVLMALWGESENDFIGRSIELYRDPSVKWAGEEVGGIRIKAMTHIKGRQILRLTVGRGRKQKFVIQELLLDSAPVQSAQHPNPDPFKAAKNWVEGQKKEIKAMATVDTYVTDNQNFLEKLYSNYPDLHSDLIEELGRRRSTLQGVEHK